ncbi:hypothetical protein [uncultured Enterovirga sp.]|uniref:hypothetical protein n=1 Tax=uncultured Enterovirga sp. TaxID=2026352 RepID=UPI0035CB9B8D
MSTIWTVDQALKWIVSADEALVADQGQSWTVLLTGISTIPAQGPLQEGQEWSPDNREWIDQTFRMPPDEAWRQLVEALVEKTLHPLDPPEGNHRFIGARLHLTIDAAEVIDRNGALIRGKAPGGVAAPITFRSADVKALFPFDVASSEDPDATEVSIAIKEKREHPIRSFVLALWPERDGHPPTGMTPQERDNLIIDAMKSAKRKPLPSRRTIHRFFGGR